MPFKLNLICFTATIVFINFYIFETSEIYDYDNLRLIGEVKDFYKSSSVLMVYEEHKFETKYEYKLVNAIIRLSQWSIMSQFISSSQLYHTVHDESYTKQSTSPLFVYPYSDLKNLTDLVNVTRDRFTTIHAWLIMVEKNSSSGFNCNNNLNWPDRGNPLNLDPDSKLIVKCDGNTNLMRFYGFLNEMTGSFVVADWSAERGLVMNDISGLTDPRDFMGITLNLTIDAKLTDPDDSRVTVHAYMKSLLEELQKKANFNSIVEQETNAISAYDRTLGRYSGFVGTVADKEVDIGFSMIAMTPRRRKFVDFSIPLTREHYRIFVRIPSSSRIRWSAYFQVFVPEVLILLVVTVLISISLMLIVVRILNNRRLTFDLLSRIFFNVIYIFCMQGATEREIPSSDAMSVIFITLLFLSLILSTIYSAHLTSYITVLKAEIPFSNYMEFYHLTTYKVIALSYTLDEYFFQNDSLSIENSFTSRLTDISNQPNITEDGLEKVCNENVAFFLNYGYYKNIDDIPCPIDSVQVPEMEYKSIILPKNSPNTGLINYNLLRLADLGVLRHLYRKYFYEYEEIVVNKGNIISLLQIMPILMIWMIGLLVSLILLAAEIIYHRRLLVRKHRKLRMYGRRAARRFPWRKCVLKKMKIK